jgi:SAM-dependent methyltransferase
MKVTLLPSNCSIPDLLILPQDLPSLGCISRATNDYLGPFEACIKDKNVLCIGYSESEIEAYVAIFKPKSITCLTYWVGHRDAMVSKYRLVIGDITKRTIFEEGIFDAVVSLALFEHLDDVRGALLEMKRITRHGGDVLVQFGPAWSSPYGHHLYAKAGDTYLDFTSWKMPAFIHLLCSKKDITQFYLSNGYSESDVNSVLHWFYEANIINRVMYDDYLAAFVEHFQIQSIEHMSSDVPGYLLDILRKKYYPYKDFSTYGGKYWLKVIK